MLSSGQDHPNNLFTYKFLCTINTNGPRLYFHILDTYKTKITNCICDHKKQNSYSFVFILKKPRFVSIQKSNYHTLRNNQMRISFVLMIDLIALYERRRQSSRWQQQLLILTHNIQSKIHTLRAQMQMLYTHCLFDCRILSSRETTSWRWSHILPHSVRSAHMTEQYNNNDKHIDRNIVKTNNERIL